MRIPSIWKAAGDFLRDLRYAGPYGHIAVESLKVNDRVIINLIVLTPQANPRIRLGYPNYNVSGEWEKHCEPVIRAGRAVIPSVSKKKYPFTSAMCTTSAFAILISSGAHELILKKRLLANPRVWPPGFLS